MNYLITGLFGLFISVNAFSQGNSNVNPPKEDQIHVHNWIRMHPEVKLVSLDQFENSAKWERDELSMNAYTLLHKDKYPTSEEIEAFEQSGYQDGLISIDEVNFELTEIEEWIAFHPNVKLLSTEEFGALDAQKRAEIMSMPNVIIYSGKLTMEDINAFESN
jgi:hypothetical protein